MKTEVEVIKSEFIKATEGCTFMTGVFGGRYWYKPYEDEYFAFQNSNGYFILK